jgi:hypothetical protein
MNAKILATLLLTALPLAAGAGAPVQAAQEPAMDPASCPMHAEHMAAAGHATDVDRRGDATMGFSHERTTHHFLLTDQGGVIQVEANDAADTASRDMIRHHLADIAGKFAVGDFSDPQAIHDRVLPGVQEMIRLKGSIAYRYEETERGGKVVITTADSTARAAVQDFLRAQIGDHRTGDPS